MRTLSLMMFLAAAPAFAQQTGWTPAPVPNMGPTDAVSPSVRAGRSTGPGNDSPFSGIPSGSEAAGGATAADNTTGVGTPDLAR